MQRFSETVVFITGAAAGIGLAIVERLHLEGATIFAVDMNAQGLAQLAGRERVTTSLCDVSDRVQVEQAISASVAQYGRLDVLINAAGVIRLNHATEITDEDWARIISVNLTGVFYVCRAALPHLVESCGNIVNISSSSAIRGLPYGVAYAASKGGVSAMTKAIAVEYGKRGVRANTVCPANITTDMQKNSGLPADIDWDLLPRMMSLTGEMGVPADVAGMVAAIASRVDGKHINGAEYLVDAATCC